MEYKLLMESWRKFLTEDIPKQNPFSNFSSGDEKLTGFDWDPDDERGEEATEDKPMGWPIKDDSGPELRIHEFGSRGKKHHGIDIGFSLGRQVLAAHSGKLRIMIDVNAFQTKIKKFIKHCGKTYEWTFEGTALGIEGVFDKDDHRVEYKKVREAMNDYGMRGWASGVNIRVQDGPGGIMTKYFHLREIENDLVDGQPIKKGQTLGYVGKSGMFDPTEDGGRPHLHFEVWDEGRAVDPMDYLPKKV
jgi:murein DD-endopeptidase MepM/ murein hydrolase activator NlpD